MEGKRSKWEIFSCSVGEDCWCRGIRTIKNKTIIFDVATIDKEQANYIIKLHNEKLSKK